MLSKTVEYALRAVVWLAHKADAMQSADEIAEATKVPRRYLHKVLQDLARADLVSSQSGPRGGYTLTRDPAEISILDAVNAVGGIDRIRQCPLGLDGHHDLCPLHRELDKAYAATEESFRRIAVADLLGTQAASVPLCELGRGK